MRQVRDACRSECCENDLFPGDEKKRRHAMKKLMFVTLGVAAWVIGSQPVVAQAQVADAIQAVNDAVVELTDAPGLGKRTTVDVTKRWGSDRSVIDSATAKLQDGLSKAQSGGVSGGALRQLKMAVDYGKARLHKEARLSAQGALRHLCVANQDQGPGCDTVPKFGSYTAP
jgi:hypothetical protein